MAQLAERLLLTPEESGSNPVISEFYLEHVLTVEQTKMNKKRPVMAHFKKHTRRMRKRYINQTSKQWGANKEKLRNKHRSAD